MKKLYLAIALLTFVPNVASGQAIFEAKNTLASRANPFGLSERVDLSLAWKLFKDTDNPFLTMARFAMGFTGNFSVYADVGPWIEFSPLSILSFRAGFNPVLYAGIEGYALGFPDYNADFSQEEIDRRDALDESQPLVAGYATTSGTFRFKAGPILLLSEAKFEFWKAQNPEALAGGTFFYHGTHDTLIDGNGDTVFTLNNILAYEIKPSAKQTIRVGFNHEVLSLPNFEDVPDNNNRRQILGLLGSFVLGEKFAGGRLFNPEIATRVFYYLEDPNNLNEVGLNVLLRFSFTKPIAPKSEPPATTPTAEAGGEAGIEAGVKLGVEVGTEPQPEPASEPTSNPQ